MKFKSVSRRSFLTGLTGTAFAASRNVATGTPLAGGIAKNSSSPSGTQIFYKSVKWEMIEGCETVLERFQRIQELKYDGMELIAPSEIDPQEVQAASEATGLPVHGVVNNKHWEDRLSSPDSAVRTRGRRHLEQALRDAKLFGGDTVLLVPGAVRSEAETHSDVWNRSIVEIRKTLPLASKLGVRILIENVGNNFCQTPELFRDYIDAIDSPWVGAYLDIGNCRWLGPSEDWVRTLAHRIVKLDIKDQCGKKKECKIGDGNVNWPEVRKALAEINFSGWATAEVKGGGPDRLEDIATRMDRVLAIKK